MKQWKGFSYGSWRNEIDVREFIQQNYKPYEGDDSFLADPTEATKHLWNKVSDLLEKERDNGGTLDVDTQTVSTITSHKPGLY
jgi:formate C-acetyltransferase